MNKILDNDRSALLSNTHWPRLGWIFTIDLLIIFVYMGLYRGAKLGKMFSHVVSSCYPDTDHTYKPDKQ